MGQSLVLIKALDDRLYYIPENIVQRLIKKKEIKSFRRCNCWINVGNDQRKNDHVLYKGSDRRILEIDCDFYSLTIKEKLDRRFPIETIVGFGSKMRQIIEQLKQVAMTDLSVLIHGETGTGKGVAASVIHELSNRKSGPFIAVDCGAITETLIESEFFGHEKGAFTGACQRKVGKLQLANGGTIFLDEIGNLTMDMQTKLLRCLEEKVIYSVGGTKPVKLDIRIISATNNNSLIEVNKSNFREDLYYRINQFEIDMPSLRERSSDDLLIHAHAVKFLAKANCEFEKNVLGFTKEARDLLTRYYWPGNIRELKNVITRAVLLSDQYIDIEFLPKSIQESVPNDNQTVLNLSFDSYLDEALGKGETLNKIIRRIKEEAERTAIEKVYEQSGKTKKITSKALGLSYTTLYRKMKEYKLSKSPRVFTH